MSNAASGSGGGAHRARRTRDSAGRPLRVVVLVNGDACLRAHIGRDHLQDIELAGNLKQGALQSNVADEQGNVAVDVLKSALHANGRLRARGRCETQGGSSRVHVEHSAAPH